MIRCGGIKTAGVEKSYEQLEESFRQWPEEKISLYGDILKREVEELKQFDKKRSETIEVARTVYKALSARKPKGRYRVGYMSGFSALFESFPQPLIDFIMTKRLKH